MNLKPEDRKKAKGEGREGTNRCYPTSSDQKEGSQVTNYRKGLRLPGRVREPIKNFKNCLHSSEITERLAYDPSQKKGLCLKEFQISLWAYFDEG